MYIGVIYALNLFTTGLCLQILNIKSEFSKTTHSYLGKSSDAYLIKYEPELYNKINKVLNGQTISSVSSWADSIKRSKKYYWTKTFHYIDILECRKGIYDTVAIDRYCKGSCIISALYSFVEELKSRQKDNKCESGKYIFGRGQVLSDEDLLKFIIHFIEDFAEPMHLLGYERGGNNLKLKVKMPNGKIKKCSLHQLWDSLLPEYYTKIFNPLFDYDVSKPINYTSFVEQKLNDNVHIACLVYPRSTDIIVLEEYFNKEYLDTLFKNYHDMSLGTFKYIFQ